MADTWTINGTTAPAAVEEIGTHDTLSIVFRANETQLENSLRPLEPDSGMAEKVIKDGGGFTHVDRTPSGSDNTHTLVAPDNRNSLRRSEDYVVLDYSERPISQDGNRYEASVTFGYKSERSVDTNWSDGYTLGADDWLFTFDAAAVTTYRVQPHPERGSRTGMGSLKLGLTLSEVEAQIMEESAAVPDATRDAEVPDSESVSEDNSDGGRQSVYVDPPDGVDAVERGMYHVRSWQTKMINDDFYDVVVSLSSVDWPGDPLGATTSLSDASVSKS